MYARFEEAGHEIVGRQKDVLKARQASADETSQLGLDHGAWAIEIRRTTGNPSGEVLEFTHLVANPLFNEFEYDV